MKEREREVGELRSIHNPLSFDASARVYQRREDEEEITWGLVLVGGAYEVVVKEPIWFRKRLSISHSQSTSEKGCGVEYWMVLVVLGWTT